MLKTCGIISAAWIGTIIAQAATDDVLGTRIVNLSSSAAIIGIAIYYVTKLQPDILKRQDKLDETIKELSRTHVLVIDRLMDAFHRECTEQRKLFADQMRSERTRADEQATFDRDARHDQLNKFTAVMLRKGLDDESGTKPI